MTLPEKIVTFKGYRRDGEFRGQGRLLKVFCFKGSRYCVVALNWGYKVIVPWEDVFNKQDFSFTTKSLEDYL